jgi:hypothetical protein
MAWIQQNLNFAKKPVRLQEVMQARHAEAMSELNRQQQQTQIRLAQAQLDKLERQQRQQAYQQWQATRNTQRRSENLPPSMLNGRNLTDQFNAGIPFTSESEWKQFAHTMVIETFRIRREQGQPEAETFQDTVEAMVTGQLIGPNALKHKDGYIVIGNRAYGKAEAPVKAKQFIKHLMQHDEYPPLRYPNNPNLPQNAYPDVTELYDQKLREIVQVTKEAYKENGKYLGVYKLFLKSFGDNKAFDLQVNHGLPGQVVSNVEVITDRNGNVITTDEYAIYQGRIVRAGYLSNYAFGYACAAGKLSKEETFATAWGAGDIKMKLFDDLNTEDNRAIEDGYIDYWRKHSCERKPNTLLDYF